MRKSTLMRAATASLLTASLLSCQKEVAVLPNAITAGKSTSQNIGANYYFDWEGTSANPTTKMPVSAKYNITDVYVPWRSQGGTPLDPGILNDYHKSDGWELVYNSFAPDDYPNVGDKGSIATANAQPLGGLYFALYNRYRGLLRYYMFVPPNSLVAGSTQLSHGLHFYSSSSVNSMLNFEGADIVDAAGKTTGFTKTSKDGADATGGWYAMQYQIGYDPTLAGSTFPNPGFQWDTYSLSISQLNLNGTEVGTTRGAINTPAADVNWAGVATSAVLGIAEVFLAGGTNAAKTGFSAAAQAAQGGLSGSASGILSGIFGGSAASTQSVDLTTNASITTSGTSTGSTPYEQNSFVIPGQATGGSNGLAPLITYPIGLFNFSGRPTIHVHTQRTATTGPNGSGYTYNNSYTLDASAVEALMQRNPAVFNTTATGAAYSGFKAEVVIVDPDPNSGFYSSGTMETSGTHTLYTGGAVTMVYNTVHGGQPSPTGQLAAVRVSFKVTPNTTSTPPVFIVKTFLANVVAI